MASSSGSAPGSCGADRPVEKVTWHMAADFARTLSVREGLEECYACVDGGSSTACEPIGDPYDCGGYRLPTEAEWEYAARCGDDLLYAGSDDVGAVACCSGNASTGPRVVATKAANACCLYPMSGNVEEWVGDNCGEDCYTFSPDLDPVGPSTGSRRGRCGGGWTSDALNVRVADRRALAPEDRYSYLGFRLARTAL